MQSFEVSVESKKTGKTTVPQIVLAGSWLAHQGFKEGEKAAVVVVSGKVVILPRESRMSSEKAQVLLGSLALTLELLQDSLLMVYPELPEGPEPMLEGLAPMALGPELKSILECLISDDIEKPLSDDGQADGKDGHAKKE